MRNTMTAIRPIRAVGFCFEHAGMMVGMLGMVNEDGTHGIVASHTSSNESWAESDIREKPELIESGLTLEWLGRVGHDDPRTAMFRE